MSGNYKVKIKDIQNKYKFKIFCASNYDDSDLRKMIESVFYALPRTTGTGTSVTLNDTAFSYLKNKLYATDTSQNGTPTPETPQTIHTISGDNEVVVCGKNLLNFNKYIRTSSNITYNSQTDNSVSASGTNAWGSFVYFFANVEKNTDYTLSINTIEKGCVSHKSLQIVGNSTTSTSGSTTITSKDIGTLQLNTPTDAYVSFNSGEYDYIGLVFWNNYSATALSTSSIWEINEAQLEKGTSSSQYEPYQSNSVLLTLGDKEICKIGNYEDKIFKAIKGNEIYDSLSVEEKNTLDYGKWYLRKAISKKTLNGSENWSKTSTSAMSGTSRFIYQFDDIINGDNDTTNTNIYVISNYFKATYWQDIYVNNTTDKNLISNYNSNNNLHRLVLRIDDNIANDVEPLKTWLSAHNTIVYYVLQTPTNEKFNDTIQEQLEDIYFNMLSYEGQTNISQINNDLPFNINSSALKDLSDL